MNTRPYRLNDAILLMCGIVSAIFMLSSCDLLPNFLGSESNDITGYIDVHDIKFSDDLKKISVQCQLLKDIPGLEGLDTSKFRVKVSDFNSNGVPSFWKSQPVLDSVCWAGTDIIRESDICMLAVVDLTRPENELAMVKKMLKRYHTLFGENLFLTFMLPAGQLSYTMPATEYAIDVYVSNTSVLRDRISKTNQTARTTYLYTSLSELMDRLADQQTHTYLDSTSNISVAVFSSEDVYDEESNYPYDPHHFEVQDKILNQLRYFPEHISFFFLDGHRPEGEEDVEERRLSIIDIICNSTGGQYLNDFNIISFERMVMNRYDVFVPDFELHLGNKIGNVYMGKVKSLKVEFFYPKDSLIATASKSYRMADIYHPTIVGDVSALSIVFRGSARALSVLILIYVLLQFLLPGVRYQIFRRRHIVEYSGPRQTHNGIPLTDTCYLCKGEFKPGDKVVVKCSHVVHEECWEENDQHCPEYGISCKDGSHFYDRKHPYNLRNAPYYTKWLIIAVITAWASWAIFAFLPGEIHYHIVEAITRNLVDKIDSLSMSSVDILSARHYLLTTFAFHISFISTLVISVIAVHRRKPGTFVMDILCRSLFAGLVSFILFGLQCAFLVSMGKYESSLFLEILPWFLSVVTVEYTVAYRSALRPKHSRYLISGLILSGFLTIISPFASVDSVDQLVNIVLFYIIYIAGISFVMIEPDVLKRYAYLSAKGPFKELDIALYKWFVSSPSAVVTIGKSVDCSLNLFMDLSGGVAPVHCSIRMENGVHKLCISDNDVELNGHIAKHHKEYRLYYGDVFKVGGVQFRYYGI